MSDDLKVTVTIGREDVQKEKEIAFRAGYCVGLAYAALPYKTQRHFQHFGVRVWSYKRGSVTVDVKLMAWFPHRKVQQNSEQFQEYERNFSILMYLQGVQIHNAQYEGKLALYLPTLCSDIANGVIRWLNKIENDHDETRKNKNDGLMKIYLPDSNIGNMGFTQIGDLWKET